jgi:hypothetical protein
VILLNLGKQDYIIRRGDRIAQIIIASDTRWPNGRKENWGPQHVEPEGLAPPAHREFLAG